MEAGGHRTEAIRVTMSPDRRVMEVMEAIGTKWSSPERERIEGGVQTDVGGLTLDDMKEDELRRGTGAGRGIVTERVGGPSLLKDTGRDPEAVPRAESESEVAGRRSGTGGQRARRVKSEVILLPGAEILKTPLRRESVNGSVNGSVKETETGTKRKETMRKKRTSCSNRPGSAALTLRTSTPTTPWTKWYRHTLRALYSI